MDNIKILFDIISTFLFHCYGNPHNTIEAHNRELSKQLGEAEGRVAALERESEASKQEFKNLNAEQERLQSQLMSAQDLVREREVRVSSLERDKAIAEARAGDLIHQVEREEHRAKELEARNQELSERLTQEAAKAASAEERAKQMENHIKQLQEEIQLSREKE